nr:sulfate ABC transporter substrate-binding protein [Arboricoccus pini]
MWQSRPLTTGRRLVLAALIGLSTIGAARADVTLLNVSYDPTRELYRAINEAFAAKWKAEHGETLTLRASHGGSGAQARSVIDGIPADVVTLALAADIDVIAERTKKIAPDWQSRLPDNSTPYTSTIVFVVKAGNPKGIKDWGDLAKPGVSVITPNPKTSGGARWNYLAAWGWAEDQYKDDAKVRDYMTALFKNVPVLDTGARGSTLTFAQRGIGDVLISWENDAWLALQEFGGGKYEIVVPPKSILAEPPVAVVDANVDAHGTRTQAEAYLKFLYTPEAQKIIAHNYYRPRDPSAADPEDLKRFAPVDLFTIERFGGWKKAQAEHFGDGGTFDQIFKAGR